jgi:hypothetical protein
MIGKRLIIIPETEDRLLIGLRPVEENTRSALHAKKIGARLLHDGDPMLLGSLFLKGEGIGQNDVGLWTQSIVIISSVRPIVAA